MVDKRAICHEAGHAIVARHLGFYVGKISVDGGRPRMEWDRDSNDAPIKQKFVVLASGAAGEQFEFDDYDRLGCANDQKIIEEMGGSEIADYIPKAASIIQSNISRWLLMRGRLAVKWIEHEAAAGNNAFASDPPCTLFDLLSHAEIEEIWGSSPHLP